MKLIEMLEAELVEQDTVEAILFGQYEDWTPADEPVSIKKAELRLRRAFRRSEYSK